MFRGADILLSLHDLVLNLIFKPWSIPARRVRIKSFVHPQTLRHDMEDDKVQRMPKRADLAREDARAAMLEGRQSAYTGNAVGVIPQQFEWIRRG